MERDIGPIELMYRITASIAVFFVLVAACVAISGWVERTTARLDALEQRVEQLEGE